MSFNEKKMFHHQVEKNLALHDIHVRTGCFCNPAACQRYLQLSDDDVYNQFKVIKKKIFAFIAT